MTWVTSTGNTAPTLGGSDVIVIWQEGFDCLWRVYRELCLMLIRALQAAAGNFGVTGYAIDNSLRFNDDDSAYLSRTPAQNCINQIQKTNLYNYNECLDKITVKHKKNWKEIFTDLI
jgi:hypothetical protein